MKKTFATVSLLLLLLFSFAIVTNAQDVEPSLVFSPSTVDFGTITYGDEVPEPVTVIVTNMGLKAVTIPTIQPICSNPDTIFMQGVAYPCVVVTIEPGKSLSYSVNVSENPAAGYYRDTFSVGDGTFTVCLNVEKADFTPPAITKPLKGTYGDWLHSVRFPEIDCGYYAWADIYTRSTKVGDVGINTFYATYYPPNLNNFKPVEKIPVQIEVSPAKPMFTLPEPTALCGQRLSDVVLPKGFAWTVKSPENIKLSYGTAYHTATFFPEDSVNYQIVQVEIPVTVLHTPGSQTEYIIDSDTHSYMCSCGTKIKENHIYSGEDETKVCTLCGYSPSSETGAETEPPEESKTWVAVLIEKMRSFFMRIFNLLVKIIK